MKVEVNAFWVHLNPQKMFISTSISTSSSPIWAISTSIAAASAELAGVRGSWSQEHGGHVPTGLLLRRVS